MEQLTQEFEQVITIAGRYGLDIQKACETLRTMRTYQVTIPILGAFNTGKSSMLNTLLGLRLLPTGITACTSVPTELVAGPNDVTVYRSGRESHVGLGELRGSVDLQGVSRLKVSFDNPFLQRIPSIKVVDMPGLDSGVPGREAVLRQYLPQSLGYLLVFSADEPVVKESISLFLSELKLMDVPVFAVLTKCDKVSAEELEQARTFLTERLRRMFPDQEISLCCISARESDGVKPLERLLLSLQMQAQSLASGSFAARLMETCREIRQYLNFRLSYENLSQSELDSQTARLEAQSAELRKAIHQAGARFDERTAAAKKAIAEKLEQVLTDVALPIEVMFASGQDPHTYVDGLLRSTISSAVLEYLEPAVGIYLRQVISLLERRGTAGAEGAVVERLRQETADRFSKKTSTPAVELLLSRLPDTRLIFDKLGDGGKYLNERKRSALHQKVEQELLPELRETLTHCVQEGLEQSITDVHQLVETAAQEESRSQQQALADIQTAQQSSGSLQEEDRRRLREDLDTVGALLLELERKEEVL